MKLMRVGIALVVSAFMACFTQAEGVAKVGNTEYATIDEAIAKWTNNTTLTLLADVTLTDVVTLKSTEHHILNLGPYTMTAASGKNVIVIQACGNGSAERYAITINADATNPGGINAGSKCVVYYKYADGGISTEDRPIIKINGGVFTGSTSSWGTAGIYTIGTAARKCATLNVSGGTFNCSINGSGKSKLLISGGTFNYSVGSQGDSTALRLISGGKFKTLGFMTADSNNTKFWFGTSMANSNVGLYVDDEGYLVVGGPVITELSAKYKAKASNATKWSSYLAYSSAATNGLYYTNPEAAIKKHGEANVMVYVPAVNVGSGVTAPEGIKDNLAVEEYDVALPTDVKSFSIELTGAPADADKVVFTVEPKNEAGDKVSEPASAITFRLPVPAAWAGFAKVSHDGKAMGVYEIKEANGDKYVEVSSATFSEFAVELAAVELPGEDDKAASEAFGTNTVFDGTNYYATLQAAVEAVCGTNGATLYCKPGADVGSLMHAPVTATLTIYGNDAYVSGGSERDFDIGNTDPSGGKDITADMTLTVKDLEGCGAWGAKATDHTVNLIFEDCQNMGKVFITGTTGTLNITIKDSAFEGVIKEAVYSNADGAITLTNVDFSNLNKAVNLNHKAAGTQTVTITDCSFTNCGSDVSADQIPVRVLSSVEGGKSELTVSGTTFTGTPEGGADILLDYGVGETTANISTAGTAANVVVEKTENVGTTTTIPANTQNQAFATVDPVAKIGETPYATLEAAFAAATEGQTITLLSDAAWTKDYGTGAPTIASVIDLGGKTLTIADGNIRFSTITLKNGNIVIDPAGSYSGNGVFYMFDEKVLTLDNVKLTAENFTGYSIFCMEGNSDLVLQNGTEITVKNANIYGIVAAVSEGEVTIDNAKITGETITGRGFLNGNYTIKGSSEITLTGVTKDGFYIGAGDTLNIQDTAKVAITLNADGDDRYGINVNTSATYTKASTATVTATDNIPVVAKIGDTPYATLQAAIDAAQDDDVITFLCDVTQADGVVITDKKLTIDLNGKTFTVSEGASTNNRNFKINGASEVVISNGTMVAAGDYSSGAYGTVRTEDTAKVELQDLKLYNYRGNGLNVKALGGTTVTMTEVEIYAQYGGGVEAAGGTVELTDVVVQQKGMYTAPWNSMAISVNGGGTVTVQSGTYSTECLTAEEANNQGTSHGPWVAGVLNSGGTLIINGGTFSNDNFGENSLATYARGAILADTGANIQINGGTFNVLKTVVDIQNNLGDASKNPTGEIKGGIFSADPSNAYVKVAEGYVVVDNNGVYTVAKAVAKIGETYYATLADAVAAANSGDTIVLKAGEYELPLFANKELTFKGESKEGVIINDAPDANTQGWLGSTFHFENLTAKGATANYHGLANGVVAVTYKDCIIKGLRFLYANEVSFETCEFKAEGVEHSFWTYGAPKVTVSNCNFSYTDRAVNCYSENGAEHELDIAFTDCTFTYAGTADAPEGAVEINSGSVKSIELAMDNCTAPQKGAMWYNSQWDSKKGQNTVVIVDDVAVWPLVAEVNGVKYADLQEALDAAVAGDTIVLLADVTCTEKPVFSKGGIVNVDVNGHVLVSTEQARVRNVVSADGVVPSNNIKFVSGFGWEVYSPNTTEGVNFRVFPTLDAVIAYEPAKPNPARIYPYEDVKQDKDVVLRKYGHGTSSTICIDPEYDITWDLNGYTVLQESPTGNPLEACIRGKFTLKDSSAEQTGKWIAGACGVTNPANSWYGNGGPALYVLGKGEAVLEGGTISIARNATSDTAGNEIVNSGGLIRVDGGKLDVNGATLQVDDTYGVMAWGGEIEINAGTFDIDPTVSVPVYAVGYYEDVAVEVNSSFDGALCVYGNVAGYKGASAMVNVAGVEYATGSGWVVPSVGEGLMTFNGLVLEEGVAVVTNATSVNTYATLADALNAAQAGDTIELLADIEATEVIALDKNLTINGNGHKVTSSATRVFRITTGNIEVAFDDVDIVSSAVRSANVDSIRGISIDNVNGVKLTLNDCSVDFTDASANDWAYAVNQSGDNSSGNTITIIGGTYEGANVINIHGANHNVTVQDATLNSTYLDHDQYYGAGIWVQENPGSSVEATGNTFNGSNAVAFNLGTSTTLTESNNTDNTTRCVAKIGNTYYTTLQTALDAAQAGDTIELLADIEATEVIALDKNLTINGNGHKVTSSATRVFRVTTANTEVTLNDVNMISTAVRVGTNDIRGISIDILDNVELTLTNCSVDFTDPSANDWAYAVNVTGGNNHTLTVTGGTYEGANVINVRGANHIVTVQDATLNSTYLDHDQYYGAGIWVQANLGSSVEATGNTFNGSNAVAFNLGTGTTLTESNNTDNTTRCVAKIGEQYYTSLEAALAAATEGQEVTLLVPPTADEGVEITAGQLTGVAAYEAATLLGGTFKKTAEGTLHYDYAFGVSNVTYTGGDDFTLTIAIEDADSTEDRTLTGRTLLIDMKVDGAVVDTFTVPNPVFVAVNDQVTCDVDVELSTLTLGNGEGKATYFEVKVSDAAVVAP